MLQVNDRIQIPLRHLKFHFVRSQGPGGQNVNKVNSKAVLTWDITGSRELPSDVKTRFLNQFRSRINKDGTIIITSQRYRDQGRNVGDCLTKLREMILSVAVPPRPRKKTRPSRASVRRRLNDKREQSKKKQSRRRQKWED